MRIASPEFFLPYSWDIENLHHNFSSHPNSIKAKNALSNDSNNDHEKLPLFGQTGLLANARKIVFDATPEEEKTIASIQTIAGTGANHLGALLLAKACRPHTVWTSDPPWINHHEICTLVDPAIRRQTYPYRSPGAFSVDFESMVRTLRKLRTMTTAGDVVVLHGCAHNPTGLDLSMEQWGLIAELCEQRGLIPFFDLAYQGFATGGLASDACSIRYFLRHTSLEILVGQSFSKNFGLYAERVGALHVVCRMQTARAKTLAMLTRLSRAEITTPPIGGARIVSEILGDEELTAQWLDDLANMSGRMEPMRRRLVEGLCECRTPGS